jgi:hypothetical protein
MVSVSALSGASTNAMQDRPSEISGIVIYQDLSQSGSPWAFSVVSNVRGACYFKNLAIHLPKVGRHKMFPSRTLMVPLGKAHECEATDLEDIAILDGKVVVLSEDSAKLFLEGGGVVDYSGIDQLREVDNHYGLEGLAVRKNGGSAYRVAVLWEGGKDRENRPAAPRLFIHTVESSQLGAHRPLALTEKDGLLTILDYQQLLSLTGEEPGTVFRTPALVWSHLSNGQAALIVLVGVDAPSKFHKKWLVRFNEDGTPVGAAVSLQTLKMPRELASRNWEGISWTSHGKGLVLVDDAKDGAVLFSVQPPKGWKP